MLRRSLVALTLLAPLTGQSRYDFNRLNGSDTRPFTLLDRQDGWSEQTFRASNRCGVTATLSHDGSKSLRFQEVGPGYGCDASRINDRNWSYPGFTGTETSAYFQADMQVGFWGGSFALGYDANRDGVIRGAQAGERGVRFTLGAQSNVGLRLVDAAGAFTRVPLAGIGISGGDWVRVRVIMDLTGGAGSGLGWVEIRNLTKNTGNVAVPGLQGVSLGLDQNATDAKNPRLWDAVWLHFEGATYGLDNIEVGKDSARSGAFGQGCGSPAPVSLRGAARPVLGQTAGAETSSIPSSALAGALLIDASRITPSLDLTAAGAPGCFLHVGPKVVSGFAVSGSSAKHSLMIPTSPWLAKQAVYLQTVAIDPGANRLGVFTSNGLSWVIDIR